MEDGNFFKKLPDDGFFFRRSTKKLLPIFRNESDTTPYIIPPFQKFLPLSRNESYTMPYILHPFNIIPPFQNKIAIPQFRPAIPFK